MATHLVGGSNPCVRGTALSDAARRIAVGAVADPRVRSSSLARDIRPRQCDAQPSRPPIRSALSAPIYHHIRCKSDALASSPFLHLNRKGILLHGFFAVQLHLLRVFS